jgi:GT2 family glycosyltransferase
VSVVICTYTEGRWTDLVAAVGSVTAQLDDGDECLVVTDHNEPLRRRAAARFGHQPAVRVVASEHPPGLSGARNSGIGHSGGAAIAFLDDDAVAAAGWLDECLTALTAPQVLAVGSAAQPQWPGGGRPVWFPPEFDWVVGCSYRGLPSQRAEVRNVIGAAMVFRRGAFALAGLFDSSVGRIGRSPVGCEETELCIRLRQAVPTARILYLPTAVVRHRVSPDRVTVGYFLRRCFGEGRSKARVAGLVGAGDALASERAYLRLVLPRALARELRRALHGRGAGLATAVAIVTGVGAAGLGYLRERTRPVAPESSTSQLGGQLHV